MSKFKLLIKKIFLILILFNANQEIKGQEREISCEQNVEEIYRKYGTDTLVNMLNTDDESWGYSYSCRNRAMHLLQDLYSVPTNKLIESLNTFGEGGRILICGVFERSRDNKTDSIVALEMSKLIIEDPSQTVKSWAAMSLQKLNFENNSIINDALIKGIIEGAQSSTSYQCAKALAMKELNEQQISLIYSKINNKNLRATYYINFRYHVTFDESDKELILKFLTDKNAVFLEEFLEQMKYTYNKYKDIQIVESLNNLRKHPSAAISDLASEILKQ